MKTTFLLSVRYVPKSSCASKLATTSSFFLLFYFFLGLGKGRANVSICTNKYSEVELETPAMPFSIYNPNLQLICGSC